MPFLTNIIARLSLILHQPLSSFCEVETAHDNALVTNKGDYISVLRINGLQKMASKADIFQIANSLRINLQGAFENAGHVLIGSYISDPDRANVEIDQINMSNCRNIAKIMHLNMDDILNERAKIWPKLMRWEQSCFILITRTSILNREEKKQMKEEQNAFFEAAPKTSEHHKFFLRSEIMAARHQGFIDRMEETLRQHDISFVHLTAHEALISAREILYRETSGSSWKPNLPKDPVMARFPDTDPSKNEKEAGDCLIWPSVYSQVFNSDAITKDGQRVQIGDYDYTPVDMMVGPEDPRPFIELASTLGKDRISWRCCFIMESGGRNALAFKRIGAHMLGMLPHNRDMLRAFSALTAAQENENHASVRFRMSAATWEEPDHTLRLRRNAATLSQRIEGWGNCKASSLSGDPLEAVLGSVPTLFNGTTAPPSLALMNDALVMMPWNKTASPWQSGSILFTKPDGSIWPYDPVGGSKRPLVCDIFVAPPGSGKSVLANTINLGLCLSSASLNSTGANLPFIGKLDIGPSAKGFVEMIRNALGPSQEHLAVYEKMQMTENFATNIFDLQVGCIYPLPLEKAFIQNFLSLVTIRPEKDAVPFEGMNQLIKLVIDEAYRLCLDVPNGKPKIYEVGREPLVDQALVTINPDCMNHSQIWWRDIVEALIKTDKLCDEVKYRLASIAQRHAVPVMADLINAARQSHIRKAFEDLRLSDTSENIITVFERYILDLIRKYPVLSQPTRLDFGSARIIVIDLADVAPVGSGEANRQTELMYMLGRYIIARNFFLHPDYISQIPQFVKAYHLKRFTDFKNTVKRLDYDEWHRTARCTSIRDQAELDVREGRKHNVQLGFSSQSLRDIGEQIIAFSTARFVLKTGDEKETKEIIDRFNLSEAGSQIIRHRLSGPGKWGAPFFVNMIIDGSSYEQLLVNFLGPIELWSLSTTPGDTNLRELLYTRLGSSEALKRLARIFPSGTATHEIERRKAERLKSGGEADIVENNVVENLAMEITNGEGLAISLRQVA